MATSMLSATSPNDALINSIQQFLIELGNGFCFVERQKRMVIDGDDFYLDLLLYHRKLHRLIAIDLKTTFTPKTILKNL